MHEPKDIKVALLQGGTSSERDISLKSGEGALAALKESGYQVECFDPAKNPDLQELLKGQFDVAFICLHGEGGEDGKIQGFLETINLPYTCSNVISSAMCMDKAITKVIYNTANIPTPKSIEINLSDLSNNISIDDLMIKIVAEIGESCAVKVPNGGSSIGVYIVHDKNSLKEALISGFKDGNTLLIEQFISGREVTVAVLDCIKSDNISDSKTQFETRALPIIEIVPIHETYDFDSKYLPGGSKHICPANLSTELTETIQYYSKRAHIALGCSGVSRTDFIIDDQGNPWALETNTVPGMTATSLVPDAANAAGMSFSDVCVLLIENALAR